MDDGAAADDGAEAPVLQQHAQGGAGVAQAGHRLLRRAVQAARRADGEADAGGGEERLSVDAAEVDRAVMALEDDGGRGGRVVRNAERVRQVVVGAGRDDAERQPGVTQRDPADAEQAVAPGQDDAIDLVPHRGDQLRHPCALHVAADQGHAARLQGGEGGGHLLGVPRKRRGDHQGRAAALVHAAPRSG